MAAHGRRWVFHLCWCRSCSFFALAVRCEQTLSKLVEASSKLTIEAQESQLAVLSELCDTGVHHSGDVKARVRANEALTEADVVPLSTSTHFANLRAKVVSGKESAKANATGAFV